MELEDPQVQSGKIQSVMRYWTRQLSAVINRTASRSILAAATNLVDRVNSESPTAVLSDQGDDTLRANHETVQRFMDFMEDRDRYGIIGVNVKSRSYSNLIFQMKVAFVV